MLKKIAPIILVLAASAAGAAGEPVKPVVSEKPKWVNFDADKREPCEGLPGCDFILLNGDPKATATQWFFRIKAGQPFPKHWHSTPENIVGVRGTLAFNFETGKSHKLKAGNYLRYQAGMVHWGQCEPGEDCLFYVFNDKPYDFHLAK